MIFRKLVSGLAVISSVALVAVPAVSLAELEVDVKGGNERVMVRKISAVITDIDAATREITLEGSLGNAITLTAGPELTRFDEFAVGDLVTATYAASLSGELRAPTEEELANPIVEVEAAGVADGEMDPGAAVGRTIRAVCTIEGMNRITRTVMLQDPEGDFHIIEDVDPARMQGVSLGDTIVMTFTQAFALTLEKQAVTE
jgi:hypothetical protein